jgi:hypothetical protein
MRTGTIYGLCEPDGTLRYVGKTVQTPRARRGDAIREAVQRGRRSPVHDWIRDLVSRGTGPALWILEEDVPARDLDDRECAWVDACRAWGSDLLNVCIGGNGGKPLTRRKRDNLSRFVSKRARLENGRFA